MSKYTTEVRFICESLASVSESGGASDVDSIVAKAQSQIFDTYPIFNENYRSELNEKILRHYYTMEICAESYGLWKLWLNTRMREIMPYYNKMYESELLKFDPLVNVNYMISHSRSETSDNNLTATQGRTGNESRTETATGNTETSSNTNTTGKNTDRYSDTPQGSIANIENNTYLTNARINDSTGTDQATGTQSVTNTTTDNSTNVSRETKEETGKTTTAENSNDYFKGHQGGESYSKLLVEFRETFLNIDMMIIEELSDLFFGLW